LGSRRKEGGKKGVVKKRKKNVSLSILFSGGEKKGNWLKEKEIRGVPRKKSRRAAWPMRKNEKRVAFMSKEWGEGPPPIRLRREAIGRKKALSRDVFKGRKKIAGCPQAVRERGGKAGREKERTNLYRSAQEKKKERKHLIWPGRAALKRQSKEGRPLFLSYIEEKGKGRPVACSRIPRPGGKKQSFERKKKRHFLPLHHLYRKGKRKKQDNP